MVRLVATTSASPAAMAVKFQFLDGAIGSGLQYFRALEIT